MSADPLLTQARRIACAVVLEYGEGDNHELQAAKDGTLWLDHPAVQAAKIALETNAARIAKMIEAVTPSGATKAAYIGEFRFDMAVVNEDGIEETHSVTVPWTTTKEIMAMIARRANI